MEFDIVFTNIQYKGEVSARPCLFHFIVVEKIVISFNYVISDFPQYTTLIFVQFYRNIIRTISTDVFALLIFNVECRLHTKQPSNGINEISYVWIMKMFARCRNP